MLLTNKRFEEVNFKFTPSHGGAAAAFPAFFAGRGLLAAAAASPRKRAGSVSEDFRANFVLATKPCRFYFLLSSETTPMIRKM